MGGFAHGYRAMLVRDIISFGFYFLIYENVKQGDTSPFWWRMISGATAGMFSWAFGFPFDSLKLRMQAGIIDPKISIFSALKQVHLTSGLPSLMKGVHV